MPIRASTSTGSTPRSAASADADRGQDRCRRRVGDQVGQDVVISANTTTTRRRCRRTHRDPVGQHVGQPAADHDRAQPDRPARMNRTFQSSARAAERGVITPVSTISTRAAERDRTRPATSPNDAATMTAARIDEGDPGLAGLRSALAASCHSAIDASSAARASALVAGDEAGRAGHQRVPRSGPWSAPRSPGCPVLLDVASGPVSPERTQTSYRRCGARPNSGLATAPRRRPRWPRTPAGHPPRSACPAPAARPSAGCCSARTPGSCAEPDARPRGPARAPAPTTGISTRQSRSARSTCACPAAGGARSGRSTSAPTSGDRQRDRGEREHGDLDAASPGDARRSAGWSWCRSASSTRRGS